MEVKHMNRTDPSFSEAVQRSREIPDNEYLDPPAEFPTLFTCRYGDVPATGCVFRNGVVYVMPEDTQAASRLGVGPCCYSNMRACENDDEHVTEIVWEWGVTRFL